MSCLSFASHGPELGGVICSEKRRVSQFDSSPAHFQVTGVHSGCYRPPPTILLQLRVHSLGFFQDGKIGIGIFPERKEIFVGGEGASAGEVGIRPL